MNNFVVLCASCELLFYCKGLSVYFDTRCEWHIQVCVTSETGEILGKNWFQRVESIILD